MNIKHKWYHNPKWNVIHQSIFLLPELSQAVSVPSFSMSVAKRHLDDIRPFMGKCERFLGEIIAWETELVPIGKNLWAMWSWWCWGQVIPPGMLCLPIALHIHPKESLHSLKLWEFKGLPEENHSRGRGGIIAPPAQNHWGNRIWRGISFAFHHGFFPWSFYFCHYFSWHKEKLHVEKESIVKRWPSLRTLDAREFCSHQVFPHSSHLL